MKQQKRRKFIADGFKIIAAFIGTAILGKNFTFAKTNDTKNEILGESANITKNKNSSRILVAYESQFGSTAEVADVIAEVLSQNGNSVEIKKIEDVEDLTLYNKVVIGSAIQYDEWMPEAREFVKVNREILCKLPVAYFFTCLVLSTKNEKTLKQANGYANKLYALAPQVKPLSVGQFAGVLDYRKMSFITNIAAKIIFAFLGVEEGDYRDWDEIRSWTKSINF